MVDVGVLVVCSAADGLCGTIRTRQREASRDAPTTWTDYRSNGRTTPDGRNGTVHIGLLIRGFGIRAPGSARTRIPTIQADTRSLGSTPGPAAHG